MTRKNLFGITYVSIWIIIWGSIGSLIDFPLLKGNIYQAGSLGQYFTFSATGFLSTAIGIYTFPKVKRILNND